MARRAYTQSVLAEKLGRSQQFVSRRISGRVPFTIEDLHDIAAVLGVSVLDLLGEEKASA